jgi:hypothetical protein
VCSDLRQEVNKVFAVFGAEPTTLEKLGKKPFAQVGILTWVVDFLL